MVAPSRATKQALSMYHSKDYLDFVLQSPSERNVDDREVLAEFGLEDASLTMRRRSEHRS